MLENAIPLAPSHARKEDPRAAAVLAGPEVRPTRTVTNFADALTCMDDLFVQYGKHDINVFSDGVPDKTGKISAGTRDMMISALDAMSLKSGAFHFVDLDTADLNVRTMNAMITGGHEGFSTASYYIKGSISQVDQEVITDTRRLGISFSRASAGMSKDRMVSDVGIDLGVYNTRTREQIRGVRTQNMVQIVRGGSGTDLEGLLPFASILYEVHHDRSQGDAQTVRTLIELSLVELMGKFTKVPYWRCLSLPSTDPTARRVALEYFSLMTNEERVTAIQSGLASARLYAGQRDGMANPDLAAAIGRYRAENNLAGGSDIDLELYFSLLSKGYSTNAEPAALRGRKHPAVLGAAPTDDALQIAMEANANPVRQGDKFRLTVQPNQDSYIYCFMGGAAEKEAYRIYPNRFSGDQPLTKAGDTVRVPASDEEFTIHLNDVGREEVACLARTDPFDAMPSAIQQSSLTTAVSGAGSLSGVEAAINELQAYDRKALHSTVRILMVDVVGQGGN